MNCRISPAASPVRLPRVSVVRAKAAGADVASSIRQDVSKCLGPDAIRKTQPSEINDDCTPSHASRTSPCTLGCTGLHPSFDFGTQISHQMYWYSYPTRLV